MPVPSTRTPVRIARGDYANISDANALAALEEGEICFATDEGRLYVKEGAGLTSVSSTNSASPTPGQVSASPAFTGGTGTQADPYLITNGAVPFASGTAISAQEITVQGTPGDIVVFTDNSDAASADRFKSQDVGIINSNGEFKLKLKYEDTPETTTDNTTYTGKLQVGTVHFTWVIVQSALTTLSESTATTISFDSLAVGGTGTAVEGVLTGGIPPYTYTTRWQRSFTGTGGWFDTGITGTSYTVVNADAGYYLRAVTTGSDSTASNSGGPLTLELPSASSSQVNVNQVATVNSITISSQGTTSSRYTGEKFDIEAVMAPEGVPTTTKNVKVEFGGTLNQYPQTDNVTSTTSGDPFGSSKFQDNDVNATGSNGASGGSSGSTSYYSWCAPTWFTGSGGQGFISMPFYYGQGNPCQMRYTLTEGINNDTPYSDVDQMTTPAGCNYYYTDTSLSQNRLWYQNESGTNTSVQVYHFSLYKPDCPIIWHSHGGWVTIDNFSVNKDSSSAGKWKPIAQNHNENFNYNILYCDANDEKYAVLANSSNIYVMEGDLTDYNNCTSTTVPFAPTVPAGYANQNITTGIAHGTKITVCVRFYVNSSYYVMRLYTCDFATNDGTSASHWVFKQELTTGGSSGIRKGKSAVNPNNTDEIYITFGDEDLFAYSSNGGESYSTVSQPSCTGWQRNGSIWGITWQRGKLVTVMRAYAVYNGSGTGITNRYWLFAQSSDGGTSWTPSQFLNQPVNSSQSPLYSYMNPESLIGADYWHPIVSNGGWVFAAGATGFNGSNTTRYYRCGLWMKDQDTINLAGTTNLTNNSIREGDRLIQPGTTPVISANIFDISGSTLKMSEFSGSTEFENNKPLQNTVSYFGATTSTLYAVMDTGGNVSDLTGTDPGYVNVGYAASNSITMPATFPSGNTPDYELPAGTTIKATVEFTNGSGSPTATSNTLTPT